MDPPYIPPPQLEMLVLEYTNNSKLLTIFPSFIRFKLYRPWITEPDWHCWHRRFGLTYPNQVSWVYVPGDPERQPREYIQQYNQVKPCQDSDTEIVDSPV
jgi:hypothetical protein